MSLNSLPIILVSAQDLNTADTLISELIGNAAIDNSANCSGLKSQVWHIKNKYYRVDVQVYPLGDSESLPSDLSELVEAHLIYIADTEDDILAQAEKRLSQISKADVRLLLFDGEQSPLTLQAWAHSHHYECVPMHESQVNSTDSDSDVDTNGPFKETYGIERVRAALHAHMWHGLERLNLPAITSCLDNIVLSSDEEWGGAANEDEDGEEDDVERAEAFAAALGALAEARAGASAAIGDEARRRQAEHALNAFCCAMGTKLDLL